MQVSTQGESAPDNVDELVVQVYERALAAPRAAPAAVTDEFPTRQAEVEWAVHVLADVFRRARHAKPQALTVYRNHREVEASLAAAARECVSEVLMMQTCIAQEPPEAPYARPLVLDAVRRGARGRLLYPHTGRGDTVTRSYLCDVTGAGGEIRTSGDIFERFIVFDRRTAFILTSGDGEEDHAGAVVEEPAIIGFLRRVHDHAWQSAMRFDPAQPGYSGALGVLKTSILGMLAAGLTDNVIARRTGISERTLRRHIAAIMRDMSADSRFQAGVTAAKAGLVEPPTNELRTTEQSPTEQSPTAGGPPGGHQCS